MIEELIKWAVIEGQQSSLEYAVDPALVTGGHGGPLTSFDKGPVYGFTPVLQEDGGYKLFSNYSNKELKIEGLKD